ncbi:MAG: hypothetical protein AAGI52_02260 [Bacteroidota bacterium]
MPRRDSDLMLDDVLTAIDAVTTKWENDAKLWRDAVANSDDETHRQNCLRREEVLLACTRSLRAAIADLDL